MSCIVKPSHPLPFRQRHGVEVVRGVIERVKAVMTVSVADASGEYEKLLELEVELTAEQLRQIARSLR